MKVSLIFLFLFVSSVLAQEKRMPIDKLPPVTDWKKAYDHAKAGKTVQLKVFDAKLIPGFAGFTPMRVYIVDGDKKYFVASAMPFPKDSTSNFLFDLSPVLKDLPQAPSPDANIMITGATYAGIAITLR